MSVANLSYDLVKKEYTLDLRMFLDDFLVVTGALPADSNPFGQILAAPSKNTVRNYLADHFTLFFNGLPVELKVEKVKTEELTIHIQFEVVTTTEPQDIKEIKIVNTIFTSEFPNQRNIVHISIPDKKKKSLLFNQFQAEERATW